MVASPVRSRPALCMLALALVALVAPTGVTLAAAAPAPAGVTSAVAAPAPAGLPSAAAAPVLPALQAPTRPNCPPPQPGHARCLSEVVTMPLGAARPFTGPAGYGPADLQRAYGVTALAASRGDDQTIAIVDAYDNPNAERDLAEYRKRFDLPPCGSSDGCFRKLDQRGGTAYPDTDVGWGLEIALDLDMASALCPRCRLVLVEADSDLLDDLATAVETAAALGATQISNSYGSPESPGQIDAAYDQPGIAVTVSAGDDGYGVSYPASSRHVIAVGGTTLVPAPGTPRGWQETVWRGSGSGCSGFVAKPSWQRDGACSTRSVADVAADADPATGAAVYDTWGQAGHVVVGGTSEAAPIVAAIAALLGRDAASPSYPYAHPDAYNDITTGSNGSCASSYLCQAAVGYDGPTGMGTPRGPGTGQAPSGVTGPVRDTTTSATTLLATVNPNGLAASARFEYGLSPAYSQSTPALPVGAQTTAQPVAAVLAGLQPGSTYHYRVVATSPGGTTYGADALVATLPLTAGAPVAVTPPVAGPGPPPPAAFVPAPANLPGPSHAPPTPPAPPLRMLPPTGTLDVAVPRQRLAAVLARGLAVRLRVPSPRGVAVTVSVDAQGIPGLSGRRARSVALATARLYVRGARTTAATIMLSRRARRLLRGPSSPRALRLTVRVSLTDAEHGVKVTVAHVLLRR